MLQKFFNICLSPWGRC